MKEKFIESGVWWKAVMDFYRMGYGEITEIKVG